MDAGNACSQYTGGPAPKQPAYSYELPQMAPGIATSHMRFDDPLRFWFICSAAMNENLARENEVRHLLPQSDRCSSGRGKVARAVSSVCLTRTLENFS
jgi:hypothetical protein